MKFFKKLKQNLKTKKQAGFTLLETLVAVFILTLALTGPIYIATIALRSSVESRDNISAYFLAEEAIEYVRNERDQLSLNNEYVAGANWLGSTLGACLNASGPDTVCHMTRHTVDGTITFVPCVGICPPLSFNPSQSVIYGASNITGTNSKFTREIYLTGATGSPGSLIPDNEVNVIVTIKWTDKGKDKSYQLKDILHKQDYIKYYVEKDDII